MQILCGDWPRRCRLTLRDLFSRRQSIPQTRSWVYQFFIQIIVKIFEPSAIPYPDKEKNRHFIVTTGKSKLRGTCVVCNEHRVVTFCYGCGLDTPGQVHVCEPEPGNTCWEKLHAIRTGQRIGESLVQKRKLPKSAKSDRRWKYKSSQNENLIHSIKKQSGRVQSENFSQYSRYSATVDNISRTVYFLVRF